MGCAFHALFVSIGGLHHAAAHISGDDVYRHLKYEGGTHRVQRIPETGLSSRMQRIHTGTMSVIVLPQPEEVTICSSQQQGSVLLALEWVLFKTTVLLGDFIETQVL